jgi:NADPH:quinone reductase-like Zn-dependent oxidoreductase
VKAGETLVTLGTGGVSRFALQFARMFGAQVIATTSSDEKPAPCGISAPNYRVNPERHAVVRESAGGRGGDPVLEVVTPVRWSSRSKRLLSKQRSAWPAGAPVPHRVSPLGLLVPASIRFAYRPRPAS